MYVLRFRFIKYQLLKYDLVINLCPITLLTCDAFAASEKKSGVNDAGPVGRRRLEGSMTGLELLQVSFLPRPGLAVILCIGSHSDIRLERVGDGRANPILGWAKMYVQSTLIP